MKKNWKRNFRFGLLGLAIAFFFVVYQLGSDQWLPSPLNVSLMVLFMVLCPPSLLSIPIIDAEVGTSFFYVIWSIIGVLNAVLYMAIAAMTAGRGKELS
jgi:hypothetical protein